MSNHDAALSNASHYNHANYTELVPLPTTTIQPYDNDDEVSDVTTVTQNGVTVTTKVSASARRTGNSAAEAAQQRRLLARKTALLEQYNMYPQSAGQAGQRRQLQQQQQQHELSQLRDCEGDTDLMMSPTDCNKRTASYAAEVAHGKNSGKSSAGDRHAPVAASQDLVDLFFLEGSEAVNGLSFSAYPIYGSRTAEQRREAVRAVFAKYGVDTHLPAAPVARSAAETREQYWRRLSHHYIQKGTAAATEFAANPDAVQPAYEPEDPFYMIDLGRVVEQMARWRHELPMVRPHFAVKCNPNMAIMEVLGALGAGFDCASKDEIHKVLDNHMVDSPDDIVFANPCKQLGDLRAAQACGVTYVTVDNVPEMEKIGRMLPSARAIIRIKTNDAAAKCAFSTKFGAGLDDVEALLQAARQYHVEVYGVSFHVGSGNGDQSAYVSAVRDAYTVFQMAARHGFNCTILDIGGGYPGTEPVEGSGETSFETIARAMRPVLEELFGGGDVTIISEPGRYFTAATHALAMNVFASRTLRLSDVEKENCKEFQNVVNMDEPEEYQYYVNDGLYHSFNCIVFDHAHPTLLLLNDGDGADVAADGETVRSSGAGGNNNTSNGSVTAAAAAANASMTERDAVDSEEEGEHGAAESAFATDSLFASSWERRRTMPRRPLRITTIFGPTCDSMDCILKKQPFPEMKLGDWLLVPDMGSYTTAAGCPFNGFATNRREWVSSVAF